MKKILSLFFLFCLFFLVGCVRVGVNKKFYNFSKVKENLFYYFVGSKGITFDNEQISFVEEIVNHLKANKKR